MVPDLLINLSSESGTQNVDDTKEAGKIESNHNDANCISQQEVNIECRMSNWFALNIGWRNLK